MRPVNRRRSTRRRVKGKRKVTRRTNIKTRARKHRTSPKIQRKVKFSRFETSGKNNKFRPTKRDIWPPEINEPEPKPEPTGYEGLLLTRPCCEYMKNYQDSFVQLVRCERSFYFTHAVPTSNNNNCVSQLTTPRHPRHRRIQVPPPPPAPRSTDRYNEVIDERDKPHVNASRVTDFHRNECAGGLEDEGLLDEPRSSRHWVPPQNVRRCSGCERNDKGCDCPICTSFI